jgi:hypothetical protein
MSISAMKQALDVLEILPEHGGNAFTRAADALRQAIAEAEKMEPKPSLWLAIAQDGRVKYTTDSCRASDWKKSESYRLVRDYYTAPPKREWVGLTDEDLSVCDEDDEDGVLLAKYWEAKLKEKNT